MSTYTHTDLARAKQFGQCTDTPVAVYFDDWLAGPHGAGFCLYREPHHTELDIERARKWLHAERDVATLQVARPEPTPARRPITPFTTGDANARR